MILEPIIGSGNFFERTPDTRTRWEKFKDWLDLRTRISLIWGVITGEYKEWDW